MLEAYEQQERDFMEREQVLLNKLQSAPSKEKLVGCHLTISGRRFVMCYKVNGFCLSVLIFKCGGSNLNFELLLISLA